VGFGKVGKKRRVWREVCYYLGGLRSFKFIYPLRHCAVTGTSDVAERFCILFWQDPGCSKVLLLWSLPFSPDPDSSTNPVSESRSHSICHAPPCFSSGICKCIVSSPASIARVMLKWQLAFLFLSYSVQDGVLGRTSNSSFDPVRGCL
jgi:hypothetical protein